MLYETETLPYVIPPQKKLYRPDWKLPNGLYLEAKGLFTPKDRRKLLLVQEQRPEAVVALLFQEDRWTTPAKKQRYSQYAIENHFPCSVGEFIPDEWFLLTPQQIANLAVTEPMRWLQ